MQVNFKPKSNSFMEGEMGGVPTPKDQPFGFIDLTQFQDQGKWGDQMLQEGSDSSPLKGGWVEGLARLGKAVAGGMFKRKANERIKAGEDQNQQALKSAIETRDPTLLLQSKDPIAQKIAAMLLEQQINPVEEPELISGPQAEAMGWDKGTIVQHTKGKGYDVKQSPKPEGNPLIVDNMISYDKGKTWQKIDGVLSSRAPKASTSTEKDPWE